MSCLVTRSYWKLMYFESYLAHGDFVGLYEKVRGQLVGTPVLGPNATEKICAAVDMACIWYWKRVLCLQRSAATACLLKRYGIPAELVIGTRQMPFRAHAWVEVDGRVVNDKQYMSEIFMVLDRC